MIDRERDTKLTKPNCLVFFILKSNQRFMLKYHRKLNSESQEGYVDFNLGYASMFSQGTLIESI